MAKKIEIKTLQEMLDKLFWDDDLENFDTEGMIGFMVLMDLLNTERVNILRAGE